MGKYKKVELVDPDVNRYLVVVTTSAGVSAAIGTKSGRLFRSYVSASNLARRINERHTGHAFVMDMFGYDLVED